MKKNLGSADKFIRILLAVVIGVLYFTGYITGTIGIILLVVGGILLLTSFVSICPLYMLLGISTCNRKKAMQ